MDNTKLKADMKEYYDTEAILRNGRTERAEWKLEFRQRFLDLIKRENGRTLLELGAGPGYDSAFFKENGLLVKAVDISSGMVKCCREKGIDAYEFDFYHLTSLNERFDSIYSMNSLLHVPKADLPRVLGEIDAVLNGGGLFYMGLYGGKDTENDFVNDAVSSAPRHFVFNSAEYLKKVLPDFFEIVSFETICVDDTDDESLFHSITLRKKR